MKILNFKKIGLGIDLTDLVAVAKYYNSDMPDFDLNEDGIINMLDLMLLGRQIV